MIQTTLPQLHHNPGDDSYWKTVSLPKDTEAGLFLDLKYNGGKK